MNGSLKLTLAVALALGSSNALALGLGMIQVKSGLNEPLVAEIPVTGGPDETAGVSVALAAAADFERVGLSRSRILVPLEFTVATGAKGNAVIKVTTKEPVRDPFLDFLIEVNWAKGKLLREYTVLLDPPTMAPAIKGSRASTAPVKDGASSTASTQLPASSTKPAKQPRSSAAPAAPSAPAAAPSAPRAAAAGEYGPVAQGETLWEVAAATRPDESVSLNQVMVALLRSNPNAFYKDNINSLKRGAILRVPSADEIRAAGSAAAAAAEVRSQNEAARGGGAAPTLVADTGAKPSSSSSAAPAAPAAKPSDRLELVPPKAAKPSTASAEKPGSGGNGDSTVRAELARTKEALASREQETGELKSRVRELEDLKTKNDKLLTLKDSELAALQQKLKELQDKAAKPGAAPAASSTPPASSATASTTPASTTTPSSTAAKPGELTKEEIWGASSGSKTPPSTAATPPASSATAPPASSATPAATTSPPASTTPASTTPATASSSTATAPATSSSSPGETIVATPSGTTTPSSTTPPASTTSPSTATTPPASTATPPATTGTTPAAPATTPAKPATSTTAPAKPSTPAKVQPLPVQTPWYSNPTNWMYGLGGLALLGGLGFLLTRLGKKKAPAVAAGGAAYADSSSPLQDEEDALLDRLAQYPDDTSAHLELNSLYYSQGDADKFEAAAQAMYAHIYDTNMPEWQQVQAMGRELVPSNPLFADAAPTATMPAFGTHAASEPMRFDGFDDSFGAPPAAAPPPPPADDDFDFDLTAPAGKPTTPPPSAARDDDFSFDLPPPASSPSNYQTQVQPLPPMPDLAPPAPRLDDDLIAADDAIGTKLDLAKAYLDMGDPDGARSMLEEVLIEGSDGQKNEARKLLAEIR